MKNGMKNGIKSGVKNGVNMRLGRIGAAEGASAALAAMAVSGIFTFETKLLYEHGNSTYITLPLSVLLSLGIFALAAALMRKSGSKNLGELYKRAFGPAAPLFAFALSLMAVYSAYAPLSQFVRAMHGLFFDGVSYSRIVVFTMPAVVFLALLGFEAIGRTARLITPLLIAVLAASTAASVSEFEAYRLYPLPGNTAWGMAVQVLEETCTFLPALLCLLINADGLNGLKTAERAGRRAAAAAALICFVSQLALALCYTYRELGELFMPMFRINYLNKFEAHFMRLDKLAHMMWLGGGMIAGAYYIYSAARLFAQSFEIRDIRPPALGGAALAALMIMIEVEGKDREAFLALKELLNGCGFLLLALPVLLAGIAAALRSKRGLTNAKNNA